jgi:hypothetical protein
MFKFKITLDRHNARENLNYYVLPGPSLFSLPFTFKCIFVISGLEIKTAKKIMKEKEKCKTYSDR